MPHCKRDADAEGLLTAEVVDMVDVVAIRRANTATTREPGLQKKC
jgi:hypothetical protein